MSIKCSMNHRDYQYHITPFNFSSVQCLRGFLSVINSHMLYIYSIRLRLLNYGIIIGRRQVFDADFNHMSVLQATAWWRSYRCAIFTSAWNIENTCRIVFSVIIGRPVYSNSGKIEPKSFTSDSVMRTRYAKKMTHGRNYVWSNWKESAFVSRTTMCYANNTNTGKVICFCFLLSNGWSRVVGLSKCLPKCKCPTSQQTKRTKNPRK